MCVKLIVAKPGKFNQAAFDPLVKNISMHEVNFCFSLRTLPTRQDVFSATI